MSKTPTSLYEVELSDWRKTRAWIPLAFLTMTRAPPPVFYLLQVAGQARPSWRRGLTWLHVSSFTRWAPSTRAGTAPRPRAPCTAATATSCSSPSKLSSSTPGVLPWKLGSAQRSHLCQCLLVYAGSGQGHENMSGFVVCFMPLVVSAVVWIKWAERLELQVVKRGS